MRMRCHYYSIVNYLVILDMYSFHWPFWHDIHRLSLMHPSFSLSFVLSLSLSLYLMPFQPLFLPFRYFCLWRPLSLVYIVPPDGKDFISTHPAARLTAGIFLLLSFSLSLSLSLLLFLRLALSLSLYLSLEYLLYFPDRVAYHAINRLRIYPPCLPQSSLFLFSLSFSLSLPPSLAPSQAPP